MSDRPESKTEARVWVVESGGACLRTDQVATEEPLEIRLRAAGIAEGAGPVPAFRRRSEGAGRRTVAITMRTPGADFELAAGFLYGEGIIRSGDEIRGISHCEAPDLDEDKLSLAREFGITLIGFLRGERFNVYTGLERVRASRP